MLLPPSSSGSATTAICNLLNFEANCKNSRPAADPQTGGSSLVGSDIRQSTATLLAWKPSSPRACPVCISCLG